jgi:bacillithiol biosynthesis cysteine-adding enzyme BshC
MDCSTHRISYRQAGAFTKIILDYLDHDGKLKPFYSHPPTIEGIKEAIKFRKQFATNRDLLVAELNKQYSTIRTTDAVKQNIEALRSANTYTITTAHQPNIFLGPLYFLYKILHAIKLAADLEKLLPWNKFVPVYYMGSEDADLDELGHIYLGGEKLKWETKQTGVVGRMKIDKALVQLIDRMEGQLAVYPFGKEIISVIRDCYKEGETIQQATFKMVNALFEKYGLVVLIADTPGLKREMIKVFEDDLMQQVPSSIVERTTEELGRLYDVQANPREINLFYLKDDLRERIEVISGKYKVVHKHISFTKEELLAELNEHPERFSPNVILRGLFQETILPNIAFIGGGGEMAYWLELKNMFNHYGVPYPVLLLRNSFMIVEKKWREKIRKLSFETDDFFLPERELADRLVKRDTRLAVQLNGNLTNAEQLYELVKKQAVAVDATLGQHVEALKTKSLHQLRELEKKMLRAEKRKFSDQQRQIQAIKEKLFPKHGLQERIDNFSYYYAKWGSDFIQKLYEYSLGLEQEFVVMTEE